MDLRPLLRLHHSSILHQRVRCNRSPAMSVLCCRPTRCLRLGQTCPLSVSVVGLFRVLLFQQRVVWIVVAGKPKKQVLCCIGVNITAFGRKLTLLFSAILLSAFHLKCPVFFPYFELGKVRPMRSAQLQVELRRLDNQRPKLGKGNSLCKIVKCCVFCLCCELVRAA